MDTKIFIGNIAEKSDSSDLQALFEAYGKVTECDIVGNFAFVHMSDLKEAKEAIENLHGHVFNGNNIRCELSTRRTQGRKKQREWEDEEQESWAPRGRGGPPGRGYSRGARVDPYPTPGHRGPDDGMPRRRGIVDLDDQCERDIYKEAYYNLYREVLARDPMLLQEIRSGRPPAPRGAPMNPALPPVPPPHSAPLPSASAPRPYQ